MKKNDIWDPSQFKKSKIIQQLQTFTDIFKVHKCWPTISEYENVFKQFNMHIKPVAQANNINCFEEKYEPRVYLKNELQTRTHNWHDFFNAIIWLKFTKTKTALNSLHYKQAITKENGSNRSLLENRITQFDECGAVIISDNEEMLELIRNHQWQKLFIDHQDQFNGHLKCIIFGHAIFEKALNPYVGMTCHCILLHNNDILSEVKHGSFAQLDSYLSKLWLDVIATSPEKFHAFPVLGIPGYWGKQDFIFYNNRKYFR